MSLLCGPSLSGQLFQVVCSLPASCPEYFSLQTQVLGLQLTPEFKITLCSCETVPSPALAFQALQRRSRQPSSVSQSFLQKESKACHERHKERGHSTSKQTIKHLISPANLELRDTLDIRAAVFTARTFVCVPGTDLSPCQELRAQQVTGQCHLMGETPAQRGEVRSESIVPGPAGR